jgi:putative SOS response-associated peptidase YedK
LDVFSESGDQWQRWVISGQSGRRDSSVACRLTLGKRRYFCAAQQIGVNARTDSAIVHELSLDPLRWGLIPYWCQDPTGGRKPINAKSETVDRLPTFRDAYRKRRCVVPVDGFFEWKAIKGQRAKQPYAIAMKTGEPFGVGGIWENWKEPRSGHWIRTFAVITTDANQLVAEIHDRIPLIIAPEDYLRWLGEEIDPRDLMKPFPSEPMRMWPISTRVNKPENDDPSIVDPIELATDAA